MSTYGRTDRHLKNQALLQLLIKGVILCFVLVMMLCALSLHGKASAKTEKYKYYTSITISYGDTLWSIAEEYMDKDFYTKKSYIQEVKSINHLHDDIIKEGKMLIIPYYSSEYLETE